ncbi:MAG TPA: DUF72 domain-containing protein [Longimicrobiaceae bacterium]
MRLHAGTSGYAYKEWKGPFYPPDLPASGMLSFYAQHFSTVEINSTFYRLPTEETLRQWAETVPEEFTFAFKAPQVITHRKRLREAEEPTKRFFEVTASLNGRLGPVLFQLPPNFKKDLPRLEAFLEQVPEDARVAFGFRHPSWFDDELFALLREHRRPLCVEDDAQGTTPLVRTAEWGYLRLRANAYEDADLQDWLERIAAQEWSDAFVYFMHEDTGTGPRFARRLNEIFQEGPR